MRKLTIVVALIVIGIVTSGVYYLVYIPYIQTKTVCGQVTTISTFDNGYAVISGHRYELSAHTILNEVGLMQYLFDGTKFGAPDVCVEVQNGQIVGPDLPII